MQGRILVRPMSGLCNRLNVISSFAALAKRSDRTLELCWSASPGWSDEDLEQLFENGFSPVSQEMFDAANAEALRLDGEVTVTGTGGLNEDWRYGDGPGLAAVFDSVAYPVVTYWGHRPCQDLLPPEERRRLLPGFARDVRDELQSWRPVAPIRERLAELAHEFDDGTVGVHVRRGDAIRHPGYAAQFLRSSDAAFMTQMDRIVRSRPRTTFFLATDAEETQQRFQERYRRALLVNEAKQFVPSIPGAPKANQYDAVIDLFALAQTRRILGSYYSTFSKTAALLGGSRLNVVVEDSWSQRVNRMASLGRHEFARRARSTMRRPPRPPDESR